ncbi:hypothetical protein TEA_007735 [Camellia sinensis var. sinensis]|uniref:Anaphase-promoting complex subunit 4 WD40 domain-containing protein n=1 Tax=Camellia sinensis var. sinensis TaxID=542762 RepID=A0A4S4D169_CAMSN|nr:hypothetical protein TEA_007735 [Camellia sinensis var. sinensis]
MYSFPRPGTVTICEINRDLITAENLSDDQAKETYAKVLGIVFSAVSFRTDHLLPSPNLEQGLQQLGRLMRVFRGTVEVDLHGVSWHRHKHILAFISGPNHVTIRDYEDSAERKEPCNLTHESQRDVKLLEWRPNGGMTLSVACKGRICIWTASYLCNAASVRSGVTSGTIARGTGTRWTLVDFLRSHDDEQISALSWSPDGRYLASGSYEGSSFTIWDVDQGRGTPIRQGLGGISMLKWSSIGDYFFRSKVDGTFYLWEANTWTSEPWSSTSGLSR